ncbi:MAG: C-GCAxxG-C-C family protein [Candidatus Hermodarchaeota archaeon]
MAKSNLQSKFDEKVEDLEKNLPSKTVGVNCAELTLTSVLEVLNVDNYMFHNIIKPLAGGFGGYKSKEGWMGACGAVAGGCAAIGAIMGGKKLMDDDTMAQAYFKAAKYCSEFEKQFGSVVCSEICGFDFSVPDNYLKYRDEGVWAKTCYKFVVWAVDKIRNLTEEELKKNWE